MPYLAAPVSGQVDYNGDREEPRMDLAIVVSGKDDPEYKALKKQLPEIFPGPQWDPKKPSYSIVFTAFGAEAYKQIYYGGKMTKKTRKLRRRN
jgi:hypothetical protein